MQLFFDDLGKNNSSAFLLNKIFLFNLNYRFAYVDLFASCKYKPGANRFCGPIKLYKVEMLSLWKKTKARCSGKFPSSQPNPLCMLAMASNISKSPKKLKTWNIPLLKTLLDSRFKKRNARFQILRYYGHYVTESLVYNN